MNNSQYVLVSSQICVEGKIWLPWMDYPYHPKHDAITKLISGVKLFNSNNDKIHEDVSTISKSIGQTINRGNLKILIKFLTSNLNTCNNSLIVVTDQSTLKGNLNNNGKINTNKADVEELRRLRKHIQLEAVHVTLDSNRVSEFLKDELSKFNNELGQQLNL